MILGDFNGHMNMIEKDRRTDTNGKMILEWMEEFDLNLMNITNKCEGVYTRIEGDQKSAIDYIMVNKKIYDMCTKMVIDEQKLITASSDHTVITLELATKQAGKRKFGNKWKKGEFYSKDENLIKRCAEETVKGWVTKIPNNVDDICKDLKTNAEMILKKTFKKRIGIKEGEEIVEDEWMTEEIR